MSSIQSPATQKSIGYRPDVDGLRCIAVVSVVLYHSGLPFVSGGYVGVDIFFVISGYLITTIIYTDLTKERFSLLGFYNRRFRRIIPALVVVSLATTVGAAFLLMPLDFRQFGDSLTAMSVFCSNIYFYLMSGYFDTTAALKPLLHTWSLAVEEQYYAFFPLMLMVLSRISKKSIKSVVVICWVLSLAASIYEVHHDSSAAFYLIWFRAWELFTGSLIALKIFPHLEGVKAREAVAVLGLALLLYPVFFYNHGTLFPGETALPPVIGTALVIFAGEGGESRVSRLLSLKPVVFVGLVSYSFYLWHWPLFVFARYAYMNTVIPLWLGLTLAVVAFGLSVLSWRYVELPFRRMDRRKLVQIFGGAAASIVVGLSIGLLIRLGNGLPGRFPADVARIASVGLDKNPLRHVCDGRSVSDIDSDNVCYLGETSGPATFALIGDSFADALSPGVNAAALQYGRRGYDLTHGGCAPLLEVNESDDGSCRDFVRAVVALVKRHPAIDTVIVICRWTTVSEGTRFGSDRNAELFISDDQSKTKSYAENRRVMTRGLERLLAALTGRRIFIVAYIPEQAVNVPQVMGLRRYFGISGDVSVPRKDFDERQQFTHTLLAGLGRRFPFTTIDFGAKMCDARECAAMKDGVPLYADDNHLSTQAAIAMKNMFDPAFAGLRPAASISINDGLAPKKVSTSHGASN